MSFSAINTNPTYLLSPKPSKKSPNITTTGRARPNRLWFRRTFSCSAIVNQPPKSPKLTDKAGNTTRGRSSKLMYGSPSKWMSPKLDIPVVISEESTKIQSKSSDNNKNTDETDYSIKVNQNEPAKTVSDSKCGLPVINITSEENTIEETSAETLEKILFYMYHEDIEKVLIAN